MKCAREKCDYARTHARSQWKCLWVFALCGVTQSLMCCVTQSSASSLVFTFCFCSHLLLSTLCPNSHTVLVHPALSRCHSFHMFFIVFSRHLRCGIYRPHISVGRFFFQQSKLSETCPRIRQVSRAINVPIIINALLLLNIQIRMSSSGNVNVLQWNRE